MPSVPIDEFWRMIHGPDATDALIASQTHELIREAVRLLKHSDGLV